MSQFLKGLKNFINALKINSEISNMKYFRKMELDARAHRSLTPLNSAPYSKVHIVFETFIHFLTFSMHLEFRNQLHIQACQSDGESIQSQALSFQLDDNKESDKSFTIKKG